ncbi:MAG TPA: NAD(P)/FAD-dependent oxidoreductase [Egibacteraceae bacterium]|nr:NAD(P)/FAD-dependent oxidoreductase [Egibacteraceae bacterium]
MPAASRPRYDAVVVGAGPNGLSAAVTLAMAGRGVLVVEGADRIGGGARTAEVTLPGFAHDLCSAIHPLAVATPFLPRLPLDRHGLEWVHPEVLVAHPLDDGRAGVLRRSLEDTADGLGDADGRAWRRLFRAPLHAWDDVAGQLVAPLSLPRHPLALAGTALQALLPARGVMRGMFTGEEAQALFTGAAAHAFMRLDAPFSAAFGLVLIAAGHAHGWPLARGGSQAIADALASYLVELGGEIVTGWQVRSVEELPPAEQYLLDVTPRQLLGVAGHRFPPRYQRQLQRYAYGPGAFKVDYALSGPVPWRNADARRAGTVHVAGTMEELAAAEHAVVQGRVPERPFVLVAQQSLFDGTRAPAGTHTLWAYCHVPHGCTEDMTERMERQIDRFAPGWRDLVLARATRGPADLEAYNPNFVGGDIAGGNHGVHKLLAGPTLRLRPHTTPDPTIFLCSSSTPPGPGVHGLCGWHAARAALLAQTSRRAT